MTKQDEIVTEAGDRLESARQTILATLGCYRDDMPSAAVGAFQMAARMIEAEQAMRAASQERVDDDAEWLHIVFDGPPGAESGRFVECETADGRSINVGQWHERDDGLWELRIRKIADRLTLTRRVDA